MRDYSICPIDINRPKSSRIKLGIRNSKLVSTVRNSLASKQCCLFYVRSNMENAQKLLGRLIFDSGNNAHL